MTEPFGNDVIEQYNLTVEGYHEENGGRPEPYDEHRWKQPKRYCVYVLHCDGHYSETDFKKSWRKWARRYRNSDDVESYSADPPNWSWAAHYAEQRYYVGETSNLFERLIDHGWEFEKSSIFTSVFTPLWVADWHWCNTKEQALQMEEELAQMYSTPSENEFSYYA